MRFIMNTVEQATKKLVNKGYSESVVTEAFYHYMTAVIQADKHERNGLLDAILHEDELELKAEKYNK